MTHISHVHRPRYRFHISYCFRVIEDGIIPKNFWSGTYTFIHTFNSRPSLPQRGRNKQKRHDLRQLSLALVVDEERGLPLYYRCYEGNVTDVVALGASLQEMVGQFLPQAVSPRLTLVLDKGNVSHAN